MKWLFIVMFILIVGATSVQASPIGQQTLRRLDTGTVVMQDANWKWGRDNKLIVNNGQDLDAVISLAQENTPLIAVYVRAGESYVLDDVWHSTFTLSWVLGEDWDSSAATFTRKVQRNLFDQSLVFDRTLITPGVQYSYWKAYLGSPRAGDPKTLEELGGVHSFPKMSVPCTNQMIINDEPNACLEPDD